MAGGIELFDIVLSFDTTGSMSSCIGAVKQRMREIMRTLQRDIPGIKMGVIAHGDYDTNRVYVIKYENLTEDVNNLCEFVKSARGTGGGDPHLNSDEAYELALKYARTKMRWRPDSNRVLVMIGDCRPHEKNYFLNIERIDWKQEIIGLRNMGVKINAVQCQGPSYADSFYQKIASVTFGHHVPLEDIKQIEQVLMSICYREAGIGASYSGPVFPTQTLYVKPTVQYVNTAPVSVAANEDSDSESLTDEEEEEDEYLGIVCRMCQVGKPPDEFPSQTVTEKCEHAPLECLRCVVKYVGENGKCPNPDCDIKVYADATTVKLFQAKLDRMFVDYSKEMEKRDRMLMETGELFISVSTISGDSQWFQYRANMTLGELKHEAAQKLELNEKQLRLIYNDTNLKSDGRLSDYNIGPYSNISLIVPLYCVPEHLDHVVFDLSWEFPDYNPDFLDATCFAFENEEFVQIIDWTHSTNKYYLDNSVKHSEKNVTGPGARTGHQTIEVHLKKVPRNITHLYFTLSSWRSPNLSAFKHPSLKFYEASSVNVNLCETTISHALSSQAVIMCSAVRERSRWQIFECSVRSLVQGNARNYNPIRERIAELIKQGL